MLSLAKDELKRADHLLHVSLKYSRSGDVMKNIIHRLINVFDNGFIHILEYLQERKKIQSIPLTPLSRAEALKRYTRMIPLLDFLNFYFYLKEIDRAEFTRKEEFRKNVRIVLMYDDNVVEIDVPTLETYYHKTNEFFSFVEEKF